MSSERASTSGRDASSMDMTLLMNRIKAMDAEIDELSVLVREADAATDFGGRVEYLAKELSDLKRWLDCFAK